MSAIEIVIKRLIATPAVVALVPAPKIHPIRAPQDTDPPFILVSHTGETDAATLDGGFGYYETRAQVTIITRNATQAVSTIGRPVIEALSGVVKQSDARFRDVDIWKSDTDFVDSDDLQTTYRRVIEFYVRWRHAA